jgi:Holliday junction resolvasome RuvABC endonuclease subunit
MRASVARLLGSSALRGRAVLGLDVSTRAVGIAVIDAATVELLHNEVVTASADEHPFHIAAAVSERVAELHAVHHVARCGVEDVMKSFAPGKFHTQGLFKLARLNGMIGMEAWRRTGAAVECTMPNAIRAHFGVSSADGDALQRLLLSAGKEPIKARKDETVKLAALGFVTQLFPDLADTWALTRTGTLSKLNFDRADAVLVALHTCNRLWESALLADGDTFGQYCSEAQRQGEPTAPAVEAQLQALHRHKLLAEAKAVAAEPAEQEKDGAGAPATADQTVVEGRRKRSAQGKMATDDAAKLEEEYSAMRLQFSRSVKAEFLQQVQERAKGGLDP